MFSIHQENTCKSSLHFNLIILTDFHSFAVNEEKLERYPIWRFLLRSGYLILVKIWKWQKLLISVPFIEKTLANHVYIRIWSSWIPFSVVQWMKTNFKIGQFSRFLLRYEYAIQVQIWKWLKLLNFFPFIKKTLELECQLDLQVFFWWLEQN